MQSEELQIHTLGNLFRDVQMKPVFADSKTFPDCRPKKSLTQIRANYENEKEGSGFSLEQFVAANFETPQPYAAAFESDLKGTPSQHIKNLWAVLTRQPKGDKNSSLIPLPRPYIVPGGRFGEIYYWDSYFTMLGLRASGRVDLIQNMVDNFTHLIDAIGYIPNGNRTYYLGRSQPPFFSIAVKLLSKEKGDELLVKYLPALEKEYAFWMKGKKDLSKTKVASERVVLLPDGSILNRYWDENNTPRPEAYKEDVELAHGSQNPEHLFRHIRAAAESGWDFSSRWFREPNSFSSIHTTDIIPVDLNCLLMFHEEMLSKINDMAGNQEMGNRFKQLAEKRRIAIQKYCWSENEKFYFDYDFVAQRRTSAYTLAGAFPLFFKVATEEQARDVCLHIENKFLKSGGLLTTLEQTGQQWDAPNGWAPLQWITFMGCKNYNQIALASKIKKAWLETNDRVFKSTGKMMEKYDVTGSGDAGGGGEYPNQDGFGWTNGVYLGLQESKI